jgi:hypothetical protein
LPRLTIPERFRSGIAALGALSDETFSKLLGAMEEGLSGDDEDALGSHLESRISSLSKEEAIKLGLAIASLQGLDARSHVPSSTLAADVWDALVADSPKLTQGLSEKALKSRVGAVVDSKTIHITSAKAAELHTEVERSFCNVRILTDIRPIFTEDASETPRGMTVLHNMQVGYHDDTGRHKEFYVTLDDDDLEDLKQAIERAEKKKKVLEGMFGKSGCPFF